jgi:hypothetical protein
LILEETQSWQIAAAETVWRWTAASSPRSPAMRCSSWLACSSSSARRFVVMSLRASLPPMDTFSHWDFVGQRSEVHEGMRIIIRQRIPIRYHADLAALPDCHAPDTA